MFARRPQRINNSRESAGYHREMRFAFCKAGGRIGLLDSIIVPRYLTCGRIGADKGHLGMALDQAKIGLKVISYDDVDTGREKSRSKFQIPADAQARRHATDLFCAQPQTSNRIAAR